MYELFEHTADIGIRVRAPELATIFSDAAAGLFSVMVERLESVEVRQTIPVQLEAESLEELFHDWLAELLYLAETRRMIFRQFTARLNGLHLEAAAGGEPWDFNRHRPGAEVKAVTYHGLRVEQGAEGYLAEVILDL